MKKVVGALCVRFIDEDLEAINKASSKVGLWSSSWVRKVVLQYLEGMGERTSDVKIEDRVR
jgi:predicted DNA-binding protein